MVSESTQVTTIKDTAYNQERSKWSMFSECRAYHHCLFTAKYICQPSVATAMKFRSISQATSLKYIPLALLFPSEYALD